MIRIFTDSSADFEPSEFNKLGITVIPMSIAFGSNMYKENIDISKDDFYTRLVESPHHPSTSQPSPDDFLSAFEEAKNAGDEILGIFISSDISGTYQSATMCMKLLEYDKFYLLDSKTSTCGERILVEEAVKLRDMGKGLSEIASALEALKEKLHIFAALDTLEFLKKGGRISPAAAAIGTLANLKPIIRMGFPGQVYTVGKAIGIRKAVSSLVKQVESKKPDPNYPIYVIYSHDDCNAVMLKQALEKAGYNVNEQILPIGAVMGVHIGPDAMGVVYAEA